MENEIKNTNFATNTNANAEAAYGLLTDLLLMLKDKNLLNDLEITSLMVNNKNAADLLRTTLDHFSSK